MFDIAPSELLMVAFVALMVIGPKDLPKAMRFVGQWVARGRGVMRQFRSGFDEMMRESELKEMQDRWAAENERIMRDFPTTTPMLPLDQDAPPAMVEMPMVIDPPAPAPAPAPPVIVHNPSLPENQDDVVASQAKS